MYGYIYLTTNLVNGKKYIGQHRSSCFDRSYYGSGVLLNRALSKYGKENFSVSILKECDSEEDLNESEIYFIKKYNAVINEEFYNVANGGLGHTCDPWNKGKRGVQKVTPKQLEALEKGRHLPASNKQKDQLRERRTGIEVSEYTRALLREKRKLQVFSKETRQKMSERMSGDKNPNRIKALTTGTLIKTREKIRDSQLGRRHIHKGTENKNVLPSELDYYLSNGWELGYYYNK